jgi:hypothetical protein
VIKYVPLASDHEIGFDEASHSYSYNGWNPPSVSRVLEKTGAKAFDRTFWRLSLIRKGMTYDEAEAEMDRICREAADRGTRVHAHVEQTIEHGQPLEADELTVPFLGHWQAFAAEHGLGQVLLMEQALVNTVGVYCGTVDCLAETKDGITVIDWKTTSEIRKAKSQPWQALQLAAYAGAINRIYGLKVKQAMNVYLAPDGWKVVKYPGPKMGAAWRTFQGLLRDYWLERAELGEAYHTPLMASTALAQVESVWGPFAAS